MKKVKRGSFTIEAALLMPVIFLVLMGVLYLNFFVHNRAWLTAAAYEAAVSRKPWKDTVKMGKFMKKQIFRAGCWEVQDYQSVRISACRQAQGRVCR